MKIQFYLSRFIKTTVLMAIIVMAVGCSTQKKKGDLNATQKLYHNTTAKYNGYFNANILLTESIDKLDAQHQDNYNKVLPIYKHVVATNPKAVAEDLDEAIKKVVVVAALHSESNWTDDCYVLMGKAQYMKQDYESAEETFEYTVEEFSPEALAKKKKRKKKKRKKKVSSSKKKKDSKKKTSTKKKKNDQKAKAKSNAQKRKEYNKQLKKKKNSKKKKPIRKKKEDTEIIKKPTPKPSSKPKTEKKKKEEDTLKPYDKKEEDNYFLKHKPAYQEALLGLAKTYIGRDKYSLALRMFDKLEAMPSLFKKVEEELPVAQAHYYIKLKQENKAIEPLKKAILLAKDKEKKARYAFILAQLYHRNGQSSEAIASYQDARKFSDQYEMEFYAMLNMKRNEWQSGGSSADKAIKDLHKMLKDDKNIDYQGQIYYALADISLKNNDKKEAIKYLQLSLDHSTASSGQKVESYYLMASLYFEDEQYVRAKFYYDSTLQVIPNTDERYPEVSKYSNNLTEIANNIQIIELQDSLLAVSLLDEKELKKLAEKIEEDKKAGKTKSGGSKTSKAPQITTFGSRNKSNFVFYNENNKRTGKRTFDQVWGIRTLEDNWRRSNKADGGDISEIERVEITEEKELTAEDIARILADVPFADEDKVIANETIQKAMYELGTLYRDRLDNTEKSIETLEGLLEKYPDTKHEVDAWYYLYLAYNDLNKPNKAKAYFDKIIEKYPDTLYAKVLQDPDYLSKTENKEKDLNDYYEQTYSSFSNGKYKTASDRIRKVENLFGNETPLQPRFALLHAMCLGSIQGKEAYILSLKDVVGKYPNTPEQTRAKEILRLLGDKSALEAGVLKDSAGNDIFKIEDGKVHYCIVVFNKKVKLNDIKIGISNYNRKYHKLDRLRVSNIYLASDTNKPIMVIRKFGNKDKAMGYFDGVLKNEEEFIKEGTEYELFAVNQKNYRQILKMKSIEEYRTFFKENYAQ